MDAIFKKACLVQFSASVWQGTRMIDPALMESLGQNSDWVKARKRLINPELLGPIKTAVHQARNNIQKHALPFPITALYLIPKESLTMIDETLQQFKERFWAKVNEFEAHYEEAREEAKAVLGELWNETDYPSDVTAKFNFEWRFLILDVPSKSSVLPPEVYAREKEKFQSLMEETRTLAAEALAKEMGDIVHNLSERLSGGNKTLSSNMLNKLKEFLDAFETKNIFENERLTELVTQTREIVGGVTPYGLRYNESIRQRISTDMANLKSAIDEAIEDLPRRKLRLAA
ncbi:DUF3150 domain-containing protein [Desulfatibacillum aliphaticivorans]|uniref:DUF3150 domain-containing protein n=1 Tax=Desulfatibacillum aliphaticivorans TaxID=218208 RepID=UPI0003FED655|nr:DUF3150 domain-containing protein [Desulfatibacillum aliphaticivorans]